MQGLGDNDLTPTPGTTYSPDTTTTSSSNDTTTTTASPNDGYNIVTSEYVHPHIVSFMTLINCLFFSDSDAEMQNVISNAANSLQVSAA